MFLSLSEVMFEGMTSEFAKKVFQAMPIKIFFICFLLNGIHFLQNVAFPDQNSFPGMPDIMINFILNFIHTYTELPFISPFNIF